MKVSVITVVLNCSDTIVTCVESVANQTVPVEHIVIDGCSTDGTLDHIVKYKYKISRIISEPDLGPYYAMNKGIQLSSGDIVNFLHGDDFYAHNKVIENVLAAFEQHNIESCYGDLLYVDRKNPEKIVRYWKASEVDNRKIKLGWMPPHPTLFVRKYVYEKLGVFNTDFSIAADYELIIRFFLKNKISSHYLPEVLVKMRKGGRSNSSLRNVIAKTIEDYKVLRLHKLKGKFFIIFLKNISKVPQFFKKAYL